jgi:hypothetical protein
MPAFHTNVIKFSPLSFTSQLCQVDRPRLRLCIQFLKDSSQKFPRRALNCGSTICASDTVPPAVFQLWVSVSDKIFATNGVVQLGLNDKEDAGQLRELALGYDITLLQLQSSYTGPNSADCSVRSGNHSSKTFGGWKIRLLILYRYDSRTELKRWSSQRQIHGA